MDLLFCWTTFLSCQKAFMIWHNRKLCISNTLHSFCHFQSQAVKNICTIRIKSGDNCRKGVSIREKRGQCVLNAFATLHTVATHNFLSKKYCPKSRQIPLKILKNSKLILKAILKLSFWEIMRQILWFCHSVHSNIGKKVDWNVRLQQKNQDLVLC